MKNIIIFSYLYGTGVKKLVPSLSLTPLVYEDELKKVKETNDD